MQFNQEALAFERNFSDFRPRECVEPGDALEDGDAHVSDSQIQWQPLKVLRLMHLHAVKFAPTCRLQKIQVRFGRRLTATHANRGNNQSAS